MFFRGPNFIEYLDSLPSFNRSIDGPFRMPIVERYKVCFDYLTWFNEKEFLFVRIGNGCDCDGEN
jgi:translation elongation factor EF-1alpha